MKLLGRTRECQVLDRLLLGALEGESGALILRGEAGMGKTALLTYVTDKAQGWRVAKAVGVESEMELAYSGLHQLCAPLLDELERLPPPQRDALATVFGLSTGPPPDRFLIGLAALTLFAETAERQPLLCIVEDAHWLDQASAQVIAFVLRRLLAERIAVVCAARSGIGDHVLQGVPELAVEGLNDSDARALLLRNIHAPLDVAVCDQIVAESHGNPLALLELPRTWADGDLAGGFAVPDSRPVSGKVERSYAQRIAALAPETRLLVIAAAAEPLGDPLLLHRVAGTLEVDISALDPAVKAGLLKIGARVHFAHPLVRSAAYRSAPAADRHRVHHALALATDPETDPDRRAWHRARATPGLDEESAVELERSAGRAQSRGGLAAAALFLQWAVMLTADPLRRTERALAAARANLDAGRYDITRDLLASAQTGPLDPFQQARVDILRGQVAMFSALSGEASTSLLKAAQRLESLDAGLARETYLDAWFAALIAGNASLLDVSRAARQAPGATQRPSDLLLDSLATLTTDGRRAAAASLERTTSAFTDEACPEDAILRWNSLAVMAAWTLWDDESALRLCERALQVTRRTGALARLHIELSAFAVEAMRCGEFANASRAIEEFHEARAAIGGVVGSSLPMLLAAYQGRETEARELIRTVADDAVASGKTSLLERCHFARAILCNGLGLYEEAAAAAQHAADHMPRMYMSSWAAVELLEAATRAGQPDRARLALDRILESADHVPNDAAQGIAARSRALVAEGDEAQRHYEDAIERLGRSRLRPELARAHLLYGEWLGREGRRADAREHLRRAHDQLAAIGMGAFAERARIELVATGERVGKRREGTRADLTAQELQIARLAREGLSNPEIGARLFLSARTVEWHLGKVFTKLDISSRRQLRDAFGEVSV
ncbi:ATP-binding protein [Solirubrobacter soli]|uniref:ATP-binding protein n=1 Tax=Solirubrobacter soli TaxID=363832 RepID=UPI00041FB174|nr:LuxR family transcriptional regulator [Solirubrobacter soli]